MSKDQKKTIEIPVETVDNLERLLQFSLSSLKFWHKNEEWPTNLICDCLDELIKQIHYLKDVYIIKNVSRGNINDK